MENEDNLLNHIEIGVRNSFVEYESPKEAVYLSGLITNENKSNNFVLDSFGSELCREIQTCEEFWFSVAFITSDGVEAITEALANAKQKGIKGKILTTDYEVFTSPEALDNINFNYHDNIELKMFRCGIADGFHSKAYIFRNKEGFYRIYIGSSNLTRRALEVNKEWNTKVVCSEKSDYFKAVMATFDRDWHDKRSLPWSSCSDYAELYHDKKIAAKEFADKIKQINQSFHINDMQKEFIDKLLENIKSGKKKILLVSATGSGKTYAAALGCKKIEAKRVLFVMDKQKVLEDSMGTFMNIMREKKATDFSLLCGGKEFNTSAHYIFSTPHMILSEIEKKSSILTPDYFDFLILDEVHHLGLSKKAKSCSNKRGESNQYRLIMQYFKPNLGTLGMTATPIRMDGYDIISDFDNNVACRFSLSDSLSANLVCPFFYFGIDDAYFSDDAATFFKKINKKIGKDKYEEYLEEICSANHIQKIIRQSLSHIYSGSRLRSLIFVPSVDIGKRLADKINEVLPQLKINMGFKGFLGKAEFTEENNNKLKHQIKRFEQTNNDDAISYLITVNKLSEGIDIPSINQVIFLRPTDSPIVFSQQLGRGLRLGKGYLVVLDFIGNNDKMNYILPMSLLEAPAADKTIPAIAMNRGRVTLPGGSIITLTPKAREAILKAIEKANFYRPDIFQKAYNQAKDLVGRVPSMIELETFGNINAGNIALSPLKTYYNLVKKDKNENVGFLTKKMILDLCYLQKKIGLGKRVQEPLLLKMLIQDNNGFTSFLKEIQDEFHVVLSKKNIHFIYKVLSFHFESNPSTIRKFNNCVFINEDKDGTLSLHPAFQKEIDGNAEFKKYILYLLDYAIRNYSLHFKEKYTLKTSVKDSMTVPFVLYEQYSYEDYFTLFEMEKNVNPQTVGGYYYVLGEKVIPLFVTYDKKDRNEFNYEDYFIDSRHLVWYTKKDTTLNTPFVKQVQEYKKNNLIFLLFLKKNHNESNFFFLGSIKPTGNFIQENKPGIGNVVRIDMELDTEIKEELYQNIIYKDGIDFE